MLSVDEAINHVERLYVSITGAQPPTANNGPYAPIPPEKDPAAHVEESMARLTELLAWDQRPSPPPAPSFMPPVDVWSTDAEWVLAFDLAGVERGDVEIATAGSLLTVSGTRTLPPGAADAVRRAERPRGRFTRQLLMPPGIRLEDATARLTQGVLEIHVPKGTPREAARRAIEIS